MTSTTDMTGHPDVAEIADLTEGLLTPSRTAEIRGHLDECELCADVRASLEEIHGLLSTMPSTETMPADVAARIDVALAVEATSTANSSVDVSRETADDARVSRETSISADRPAGRPRTSTTGPGRKNDRGKRRRVTVIGAAFAAAAVGLGSVLLSSLMGGSSSGPTAENRSTAADTFSAGTLERQVTDLLAPEQDLSGGARTPDEGVTIEGGPNSPRVFDSPSVPDCVRKGIGRNEEALAVDEGTYKGTDAMLVVLPDANDTSRVTAYLMDSTCIKQASAKIATILLQTSYAHP
ncbi:anti-sigma factor family protein [Streptomyces sp. NPDC088387]|uniref:anti-sigma factor family protein n=1 Tax=Streptomyces sp. NPDC088387 TaxID=3365859 RepID=UPI0037FEB524